MTDYNTIKQGLAAYLDTELMPLIPASEKGKKFATGIILSLAIKKFDNLAEAFGQKYMLKDIGIITADGVDLDTLKEVVISNIPADGITLNIAMLGDMTIHKEDINKLYATIKNFEKEKMPS